GNKEAVVSAYGNKKQETKTSEKAAPQIIISSGTSNETIGEQGSKCVEQTPSIRIKKEEHKTVIPVIVSQGTAIPVIAEKETSDRSGPSSDKATGSVWAFILALFV